MNWKFWEWEIWKEDEPLPMPTHPTIEASHTLVIDTPDPEAFKKAQEQVSAGNPEAERIRQSLLAARQK